MKNRQDPFGAERKFFGAEWYFRPTWSLVLPGAAAAAEVGGGEVGAGEAGQQQPGGPQQGHGGHVTTAASLGQHRH